VPPATNTCGNCEAYSSNGEPLHGICRRMAPVPLVVRAEESPASKTHIMWPRVEEKDSCLEWVKK